MAIFDFHLLNPKFSRPAERYGARADKASSAFFSATKVFRCRCWREERNFQ